MALEDDTQIEYAGEASHREYINQKKKNDQAKLEKMGRWGPKRRMLPEESAQRRSPTPSRGYGVKITPPDSYD